MKDAQDAVKEIREWPVQKYLIENEDGSIEFSDNKPGRVVCSKEEFMEAKSSVVKSVKDAVRACCGVWPTESVNHLGMGRGWSGGYVGDEPDFLVIDATCTKVTRAEFEAEARRQGYVVGFDGHPDDVAFDAPFEDDQNGAYYPPPETRCRFKAVSRYGSGGYGNFTDDFEACTVKYASENGCHIIDKDGAECFMDSLDYHITFRPLKSDRERWVKAADKLVSTVEAGPYVMLETVYEALKSGELPMPEKD